MQSGCTRGVWWQGVPKREQGGREQGGEGQAGHLYSNGVWRLGSQGGKRMAAERGQRCVCGRGALDMCGGKLPGWAWKTFGQDSRQQNTTCSKMERAGLLMECTIKKGDPG